MRGESLEGMWVVLVDEHGKKVPLLARVGTNLYLLAFRNGFTARKFVTERGLTDSEPRLVVRSHVPPILVLLVERHVAGVLVDYDVEKNSYREAGLVY